MEGRHSVEKGSLEGLTSHDCDFLKKDLKRDSAFKQLSMTSGASSLDSTDSTGTLSRSFTVSNSDRSLSSTSQRDFDGLKHQCEKAMHELQLLRKQHTEIIRRYDQAMKELEYHRGQNRTALSQLDSASQETNALRSKCGELLAENQRLEREARNLQTFLEEHRKEVMELRRQQQETLSAESGGAGVDVALNQRYVAALRKYEAVKDDHDSLRKRCDDLMASHTAAVNKLELAQEEVARVKKQCEEMAQERNVAVRERNGLKQQCTAAIRQWDIALREKNEYREALAKVQQQHEEAVKEVNLAMAVRMKTTKEMKRLTEERNAAMQEYSLIMSERDTVHKEIEKLTEDVGRAAAKVEQLQSENKMLTEEKKTLSYQMETLKREIASALYDRDKALKECNDLRERFGEFTAQEESGRDGILKSRLDYDLYSRERDNSRKEQAEVSTSTRDIYGKSQKERMDNLDQANQEIDRLQKQVEKLQAELQEATQEAEVSKRRRDWAFSERDKIVLERESIRTLCDRLRKERDRAVSDLAEALRDSDDIKKQRNEASKELKELKEKMEVQAERESRSKRLHHAVNENHDHNQDSVLESDFSEWETETLDIDLSGLSPDGEELGFELVGGRDDPRYPNDSHVYVSSVTEGSIADGKLKPNDCIVRVNGLDCSQANRRAVMEAIRSGRCLGRAGVAVRRRRVGGRCLYTTQLQLNSTKDHGLVLETGVYISKITPGSLSAKEGNLAVGDRVLSINGKTLDGAQGGCDAAAALEDPGDVLTITALKGIGSGPRISPSTSSPPPPPPPLVPPPTAQGLRHNMHSSGDSHSLLVATDSDHLSLGSSVSPGGPSVVVGNSPSYGVMEDACGVVSGSSTGRNVPSNDDGPLAYSPRGQSRPPSTHSEPKHQGNGMQESSHYKVGKSGTGAGGAWEMIREKIEMVRGRRSGKDRAADERVPRPPAAPPPSPGLLGDPEQDDAIAELDSVIDSYRRKQGTDGSNAITKRSKRREKEEALEKNGGTWPKCRGVGPGIAHANGTILHPRRTKERLPLSAILGNPPRYPLEGDCTNRRKRGGSKDSGSPSSTGPPTHAAYKSLDSSLVARLEAAAVAVGLPPSPRVPVSQPDNGAIDFSVKSGNIGREVLEYYVRKKGGGGSRSGGGASEGGSDPPSHARAHSRPHGGRPLSSPPHPYPADSPFLPPAPHPHHPHPHHGPHASSPLLRSPRHSSSPSPLLLPPAPPPGETSHNEARSPCFEPPYARQSFHHSHSPSADLHYHMHPLPTHHQHTHHQPQTQTQQQQLTGSGARQQPKAYPLLSSHSHQACRGNEDIITLPCHAYEGGTFPRKKENQRIRIPSNQSVTSKSSTGKVSTGSMERSSERSSPMPTFHVEVLSPGRRGGTHPGNRNSLPADYSWVKKRDMFCRPAPGELRRVHIDKSVEPLGIQISCLESGGVFVSTVSEHSLASQVGLQVGDQLLEVCGINMRSATYQLAANVLRQCGNSITMLVQYSPDKYQELEGSGSSSGAEAEEDEEDDDDDGSGGENQRVHCHPGQVSGRRRSPSGSPTPRNSPRPLRQNNLQDDQRHRGVSQSMGDSTPEGAPLPITTLSGADEDDDGLLTGAGTLERRRASRSAPRHVASPGSNEPDKSPHDPRFVFLETKKSSNLGISLVGGNAVGIFIHSVQPDSPAYKAGLRTGDQILEYNGTDLRRATAEEAAYELAKPADKVTMLAQYNIERYEEVKDKPGDSFYIRALFERVGGVGCGDWEGMNSGGDSSNLGSLQSGNPSSGCNHPLQLNFRKDDVLYVDNTMFNGVPGHWRAWLVDDDGRRTQCGVIPSKYKVEEELLLRRSLGDLEGDRRGSTSARRSFFRRKKQHHQHQRSSSRSGGAVTSSIGSTPEPCTRELASFSSTSLGWWYSDSNTLDEPQTAPLLSYRRVRRLDHPAFRPVLIMGPLSECIVERLVGDFPEEFARCVPEILPSNVSLSAVERGLADGLIVDYRRRGPTHEVTTVTAVKEICDKNSHCVLDVSVSSVERLHRHRIYPIVLLIKFKSTKQIREVKDTRCFPNEKVSAKAAKEMYEHSLKLEAEYKHIISAVIPGGVNVAYMCTQIKGSVEQEQNKTLWVPCPSSGGLGGSPM